MDTISESPSPSPAASPATKKSRRQVAFYPNVNSSNKPQKPFSRSAAKRESVMALGSIEHLQHYFTKSGIIAESDPLKKPHNGMVPAIGSLATLPKRPQASDLPEIQLPPSPVIPEIVQPTFSPFVRAFEVDPENLRPGAIDDLGAVESIWSLNTPDASSLLSVNESKRQTLGSKHTDILELLKTTTRALRSVRNYLMSLPDDSITPMQREYRVQALSSAPLPKRHVSQPNSAMDPLSRIRRSALEVLIVLRALEESSRLPLSDDAYDAQSDHGEHMSISGSHSASGSGSGGLSRGPSPDFLDADMDTSISFVQVGGGSRSIPVWGDEAEDLNPGREDEIRERWDERLVLAGGWLYRQDIKREDLAKEREVVKRYLDAVDDTLFGGSQGGVRGWERERIRVEKERRGRGRRVSSGDMERSSTPERSHSKRRVVSVGILDAMKEMALSEEPEEVEAPSETESVEDEHLPDWAKRSLFEDNPLGRLHALLVAFLPAHLQTLLPSQPATKSALLQALTSGQLLCTAYNTGVRKSRKPWGFVSKDAIHDIATLESQAEDPKDKGKGSWTFRRTDNLRLWAAALKLRYMIPIITTNPSKSTNGRPGTPNLSSPVRTSVSADHMFPTSNSRPSEPVPTILFDAPVVARQEPGWEEMLETVVMEWMTAVVDEKRSDR
ncbi:hypothetical protein BXZ70DRAFT_887010 [Cristinia sonorae]|uniref:Uncharacterized protein n=1 Tax=Cristinia sonorae TaxID=1940300 RepID=A0A8K0UXF2_9AGAR|nr:hypothetical protein BXZ70DRAFT_887010 [Cristinia sonorae]